ncbi:MAG: quinolinate synthase NadA [Alphaproteobacteria bacterium]|nr:quinolinate synthase NadA [Alphaproteobacteria bacterium]NCQ87450.1 quinolinate synthase NadA [Alphaproteobacteria bacterium]NCT06321.1 quinolinate synthase NadA [Alphaproteobacteria bacterium]
MTDLAYTDAVAKETAPIFNLLKDQYDEEYWATIAPYIFEINTLKKEKNAVILAHNYMTPDIFHGVADIVGDSLALAREAAKTDADIIVQCGVHFMAETSKILCMDKKVLIPDLKAGCSLAESITAADVRLLREKYPGVPIVTYVNTSAEVKAESDICCTSGNAIKIVNGLDSDEVLMIPDKYLAQYTQGHTSKKILTWEGSCEVHERFTADDIHQFRARYEGVVVIAHPECPPEVLAEADFTGSTQQMIEYVEGKKPDRVVLITECSMSDNIAAVHPEMELVRPCQMCPHMKRITLPKILEALKTEQPEVVIDPELAKRALIPVNKMLEMS